MNKIKSTKGITLISLVITIIILIILAGVAINLSIGNNGIFTRAKQAKGAYKQTAAKEKVEIVLLDARIEKNENPEYNEEFLNNMLEESGIEVNGNVVTLDNYNFTIDRENLKIVTENGESNIKVSKEVQKYLEKNANGKYEAQILVTIESDKELQNVTIEKPDGTTLTLEIDKNEITKEITVEFDEAYKIIIATKEGKTITRTIIEKTEEKIRTTQDLVLFRNKVNSGLTYEGKIIKLANDIDLSTVCGENIDGREISWQTIGNNDEVFKGTFDGNNKTIYNLYIKNSDDSQALFGTSYGVIKNITISEKSSISCYTYSSSIVGFNYGTVSQCINNSTVTSSSNGSSGIAAHNYGIIEECINNGKIICGSQNCGGIVAYNLETVRNCYNTGIIQGNKYVGGISGHDGSVGLKITGKIQNCYSTGTISGSSYVGGVLGCSTSKYYSVLNSCWLLGTGPNYGINGDVYTNTNAIKIDADTLKNYAPTLGVSFISDGKKLDNNGNIVDNLDDFQNIIYINNGYPILKWQVIKNK